MSKLRPITSALTKLKQSVINIQKNYNISKPLTDQSFEVVDNLKITSLKDLNLLPQYGFKFGIGYAELYSQNDLRICAFYLPKGSKMKLHDHPKMSVISYILSGEMETRQYTKLQNKANLYQRQRSISKQKSLLTIDGIRQSEKNNLHEFFSIRNTLFLDIIFPDYNSQRVCSYYEETQKIDEKTYILKLAKQDCQPWYNI